MMLFVSSSMVYYEIFLYLAKVVWHLRDAILVFPCLVDAFTP